jgi:hypothetical protein
LLVSGIQWQFFAMQLRLFGLSLGVIRVQVQASLNVRSCLEIHSVFATGPVPE